MHSRRDSSRTTLSFAPKKWHFAFREIGLVKLEEKTEMNHILIFFSLHNLAKNCNQVDFSTEIQTFTA